MEITTGETNSGGGSVKAFVEFGSFEGTNLRDLLQDGWHGVLVEPHPLSLVKCYEFLLSLGDISFDLYSGIVSPVEGDIVTYKSGSATFSQSGHAAEVGGTPSSTWTAGHWEHHKGPGLKLVSVTLDRLVRECPYPVDRFEIDCEGMEVDIFESYSWNQKPEYIKVATHGFIIDRIVSLICKEGYEELHVEGSQDLHFRRDKQLSP